MAEWLRFRSLRDMKCTVHDVEVRLPVRLNLGFVVLLSKSYLNWNLILQQTASHARCTKSISVGFPQRSDTFANICVRLAVFQPTAQYLTPPFRFCNSHIYILIPEEECIPWMFKFNRYAKNTTDFRAISWPLPLQVASCVINFWPDESPYWWELHPHDYCICNILSCNVWGTNYSPCLTTAKSTCTCSWEKARQREIWCNVQHVHQACSFIASVWIFLTI